jgi:hypothetical protein
LEFQVVFRNSDSLKWATFSHPLSVFQ